MESGVDSGWQMLLGLLKFYVENYFGKDRELFFAMLPAQFEFPALRQLFTTEEGLNQWLQLKSAPPEKIGDRIKFVLDAGQTITGQVLALTHHEMSVSWEEIDGYLEIKSFPTGAGNKGLCLRGATYSPQNHSASDIDGLIKDTLVKLFAALSSG